MSGGLHSPPSEVPLPDEDMEEGELSPIGDGAASGEPKAVLDSDQGNVQSLPDLLQEIGGSGDVLDRQVALRMEARAKRFNIQSAGHHVHYDDIIRLYKGLGIPDSEYESRVDLSGRRYRLEAIHIRGFDGKTTKSDDIYQYFKDHDFSPVSLEWVDASSANVVWALGTSSAKALLTMSRPIVAPQQFAMDEEVDEELVLVKKADEFNSDMEDSDDAEVDEGRQQEERRDKRIREKLLKKFDRAGDQPISLTELGGGVHLDEDCSKWRLGKPSEKLGNRLFMRIATRDDTSSAADEGREGRSGGELTAANRILRNGGGLLSASRKRKLQEQMEAERAAMVEYEFSTKRYSGPVGKNPWGSIAEDWTRKTGSDRKDFALELVELADIVGGGGGKVAHRGKTDVPERQGNKPPPRDWDAPEGTETRFVTSKRRRQSDEDRQEADSESEDGDEEKWSKKLKRPRMTMIADEVENKKSAKQRIFKSIKRKVKNRHPEERILGRGLSSALRGRLGALNKGGDGEQPLTVPKLTKRTFEFVEDSGDSLEKDTGEDLKQVEGQPAANMVIQVTQSPKRKEREEEDDDDDEDEDEDEEMEIDDGGRNAISSVVAKIKTEKGEEKKNKERLRERELERERERDERKQKERERERERERTREKEKERKERERLRAERHGRREVEERKQQQRQRRASPSPPVQERRNENMRRGDLAKKAAQPPPRRAAAGVGVKREKTSDDEKKKKARKRQDSSDSSSSDSSSSDDESSSGSSSDSDSDSSSSGSSSSSSSSSSGSDSDAYKKQKPSLSKGSRSERNVKGGNARAGPSSRKSDSKSGEQDSKSSGSKGLTDKLQDYLKKAKERKKREDQKKK